MKLNEITNNSKTIRPLHDIVAFKWIKPPTTKGGIVMPDSVYSWSDQRMGHKYTCEAIVCGPECHEIKPGDRFILHEYGKVDQKEKWNEDDLMFCHEGEIEVKVDKDYADTILAGEITQAMEDHYRDDNDIQVELK
jgi:co-chaperonin GroES (HSP10)